MAMNLNNLSDFQLMEILLRLPLKSAFQCKCVSKNWCSLISSHYFARRFVLDPRTNPQPQPFTMILVKYTDKRFRNRLLITYSDQPELASLAAYLHRLSQRLWLEASCNDLLLCCAKDRLDPITKGSYYYVINPVTKQWFALPPIPIPRPGGGHGLICKCDYNNDSFSYRVVLLIPKSKLWEFNAHIFSSDTAEWSVVGFSEEFQFPSFPFISAVPYKGLLFWCNTSGSLIAFDPYNSKRRRSFVIEKPKEWEPMKLTDSVGLGVCHGCLRICQILAHHIGIWELKDYGNKGAGEWCLEHKVSINQFVSEKSPWLTQYVHRINIAHDFINILHDILGYQVHFLHDFIGFHPIDGDIIYLEINSNVLVCNLRRKTLEVFCLIPDGDHYYIVENALDFVVPYWPTPIPSSFLENAA